jgi:DNA-binding NarL/FixJ family response regulator
LHFQFASPDLPSASLKPLQKTAPLRVLLADDHEVMRMGTATLLKLELACEICAEAANGREALKLAESTRPDVAVLDVAIPGLNGLELTRQLRKLLPDTEVVILSGDNSPDMAQQALEAGAKAFIPKVDAIAHLAEAVRTAADHRFYLTPQAHESLHVRQPARPASTPGDGVTSLTDREREVVQLVAEGKSNKEVAALLGLSVKTVETHRAAIMRKLKLAGLSDLVRYAIRHRIISL